MKNTVIQEAKKLFYKSEILKCIDINKIEKQFENIIIYDTELEFLEAYGIEYPGGILKGFNRNNKNYLNPNYLTPHIVIHEVLHGLSSQFDIKGHRIKNGIEGNNDYDFSNEVNEGLTDYLAAKISGEKPEHFLNGHIFFGEIEGSLVKEYGDPNILFKIYINNNEHLLFEFLDKYGGKGTFENLYNNFLYFTPQDIRELANNINNKFDKIEKRNKIIQRIKSIFSINKVKALPECISSEKDECYKQRHSNLSNKYGVSVGNSKPNNIIQNKHEEEQKEK